MESGEEAVIALEDQMSIQIIKERFALANKQIAESKRLAEQADANLKLASRLVDALPKSLKDAAAEATNGER